MNGTVEELDLTQFEKPRLMPTKKAHSVTIKGKTTYLPADDPKAFDEAMKVVAYNKTVEVEEGSGKNKVRKLVKPCLQKFMLKIDEFFNLAVLEDMEKVIEYMEVKANSEELKAKRAEFLESELSKINRIRDGYLNRLSSLKGTKLTQHVPSSSKTDGSNIPSREDFLAQVDRGLDTAPELAKHYGMKKETIHRWAKRLGVKAKGERNSHRFLTDEAFETWKASSEYVEPEETEETEEPGQDKPF